MIRIRYSDLAPGTNGDTIREESRVIVYFVPGLSVAQRKAVLRRLRQAARRGQKPKLPPAQLALALSIDRVRRSARNLAAIVRLHPAGSMLPMIGLATLIALFLLTSVSVRILHGPYLGPGSPYGDNGTQPGHAAEASPYRTSISASRMPSVGGVALTSNSGTTGSSGTPSTSTPSSTTSPSGNTSTSGASGTVSTPDATVSVGASSTASQGVSAAANVSAGSAVSVKAAASVSASSVAVNTKISAGTANVGVGVNLAPAGAAVSVKVGNPTSTPASSTSSGTCLDIGPLGICLST